MSTKTNNELLDIITTAKKQYYYPEIYGEPVLTDEQFDSIENEYISRGETLDSGVLCSSELEDVHLPVKMPSLDKMKPRGKSNILSNWKSKYGGPNTVVSLKLDGKSALLWNHGNDRYGFYAKGDEKTGKNMSHLLPFLSKYTLLSAKLEKNTGVRGELIMTKSVFESLKNIYGYSTMRNAVSGITNSRSEKITDSKIRFVENIHFVAYEYITDASIKLPAIEQMQELISHGFETVEHIQINSDAIDEEFLSSMFNSKRVSSKYEIDGIVISAGGQQPRKPGNPEYAFAYKEDLDDQTRTVVIKNIKWSSPGRTNRINPVITFDTVDINGTNVSNATAHNAKYVITNGIGPGAVVRIIRSGDVIPYILDIQRRSTVIQMPDIPYTWDENKTFIYAINESVDHITAIMENYLKSIGVKSIGKKTLLKLYEHGIDSIRKLNNMTIDQLRELSIPGIGEKSISNYVNRIQSAIKSSDIVTIAIASGLIGNGIGVQLLKPFVTKFPDIFEYAEKSDSEENFIQSRIHDCMSIPSLASVRCNVLLSGIFRFMSEYKIMFSEEQRSYIESNTRQHPIISVSDISPQNRELISRVVLSGTRDPEIIKFVSEHGGTITGSVSSKTTLLVKHGNISTTKETNAEKFGIPIWTVKQFKDNFERVIITDNAIDKPMLIKIPNVISPPALTISHPSPPPSPPLASKLPSPQQKVFPKIKIPHINVSLLKPPPQTEPISPPISPPPHLGVSVSDAIIEILLGKTSLSKIAIKHKLDSVGIDTVDLQNKLDSLVSNNKLVKSGMRYSIPRDTDICNVVNVHDIHTKWPLIDIRSVKIGKNANANECIVYVLSKLVDHINRQIIETKRSGGKNTHSHRLIAIKKAISAIKQYDEPITSGKQLMSIPGIGKGIALRIDEILTTGTLSELNIGFSEETRIINDLMQIHGIGPERADTLMKLGVVGITDLISKYKSGKINVQKNQLTRPIVTYLEYYYDLKERIPYDECHDIEKIFTSLLHEYDSSLVSTVCGSYRRRSKDSGDIDILITHPNATDSMTLETHFPDLLKNLVKFLVNKGFIVGNLTTEGHRKYMGICKTHDKGRRIDIMFVPNESYAPAIVYFTGSANFNVAMRHVANTRNMTLNEYYLRHYNNNIEGPIIHTLDEHDVFDKIGILYVEPWDREM